MRRSAARVAALSTAHHTPPTPPAKRAQVSGAAARRAENSGLHPRNVHRSGYDFAALCATHPPLQRHVITTAFGQPSIDFAAPTAVKELNHALLRHYYQVQSWDLPAGYLCPPIPGRADYLHHLADLLTTDHHRQIPRGAAVRIFDVGVGANLIYPLLGHHTYGWHFVGSECDAGAFTVAQQTLAANPHLRGAIELRQQNNPLAAFQGVVGAREQFAACICNPPFHSSANQAKAGSERKWRQLGKTASHNHGQPVLNFGGSAHELWCDGGEVGFIMRIINESRARPTLCRWFTSLVAKETSLPPLLRALQAAHVRQHHVIELHHGQKRSRIVAWTYGDAPRQQVATSTPLTRRPRVR